MKFVRGAVACALMVATVPVCVLAQSSAKASAPANVVGRLAELVDTQGVSGYETAVAGVVRAQLAPLHPTTDNIGDVIVTVGSGAPHRLIVAAMDEPGFVVSEITADGYLRVQRLPQGGMPAMFNELASAQVRSGFQTVQMRLTEIAGPRHFSLRMSWVFSCKVSLT